MATTTMTARKAAPTTMTVALKEAGMTAFVVFMLSFLMIGFETGASQGQEMSYVTRFGAIAWGILLVPLGRMALVFDRYGQSMPALIGGGLAFLYLFGGAAISLAFGIPVVGYNEHLIGSDLAAAGGIPMPFADPIVDGIFGLGALF